MKVLVICQYFFPEQFRVNDICFELAKEGNEVTVLTGLPNYPSGIVDKKYRGLKRRNEQINGVNVIRSSLIGRGKGVKKLALNYASFALTATWKALFLKKDFDLILVYQLSPVTMGLPGILLKKITKKPLILYCHDLWPESIASAGISPNSKLYSILLKLSKWIYKSADKILTSSKLFEEYFKNTLDIHDSIIHLPVYAEELFENIKEVEHHDETINLVFAGNIGEMQSVETIIYAANEIKEERNIRFHIVGDGSSRKKCEELVDSLSLNNVIFHGQHPITEMPKFYEMADAFLITLKANKAISYTLPNKVQSYMAAGKPILGSIDGETNIVINEANCGICSRAEDYHEFALSIRKFATEIDNHNVYGENARRYYDNNFSKKVYMENLNNLLEKTILEGDGKVVQR
ncbi:glycosyltransferase family 4 protein [Peribacillus frigoritolerans]|uniref:glycosyltransferase family 4 protein n=1 Tax=Peribacillus frigoritolerans TaxID=450367 RepID=UPI002B249436|nr:glycosyltransferase family 4 protein [Peribacillus frigoritolerans]MEB2492988.1 glycosyltransferase family 4 protein [Peribacillus frigoritolerans]